MMCWSVLCLILAAFTCLTFLVDTDRFRFVSVLFVYSQSLHLKKSLKSGFITANFGGCRRPALTYRDVLLMYVTS